MKEVHLYTLREMFMASARFRLPIFQRPYSWQSKQVNDFWEDLCKATSQTPMYHFISCIACYPIHTDKSFHVIEGQQRILTTLLLLSAIRRIAISEPNTFDPMIEKEIDTIIHGNFGVNDYRVLCSDSDKMQYALLMGKCYSPDKSSGGNSKLADAYLQFKNAIEDDLARYKDLKEQNARLKHLLSTLLDRFQLNFNICGDEDDINAVYDTLNNRGMALSTFDQIRNYLFMVVPNIEASTAAYYRCWIPICNEFASEKESVQESFIRAFLFMRLCTPIPKRKTYPMFQSLLRGKPQDAILNEIQLMHYAAPVYLTVVKGKDFDGDAAISTFIKVFKNANSDILNAVVMSILTAYRMKEVSRDEVLRAFQLLESHFIRLFLTDATSGFARSLLTLLGELDPRQPYSSILAWVSPIWITDKTLKSRMASSVVYNPQSSLPKYILCRIEREINPMAKETLSLMGDAEISIEHILPQAYESRSAWMEDLGPDAPNITYPLLNSLGNLTLTKINSHLGAKPFDSKKREFSKSGYMLNKRIAKYSGWNSHSIQTRNKELAEEIINIWPSPIS